MSAQLAGAVIVALTLRICKFGCTVLAAPLHLSVRRGILFSVFEQLQGALVRNPPSVLLQVKPAGRALEDGRQHDAPLAEQHEPLRRELDRGGSAEEEGIVTENRACSHYHCQPSRYKKDYWSCTVR